MRLLKIAIGVAILVAGIGCGDRGVQLDDSAQHFVAAQQALDAGDKVKAIKELTASIQARPDEWAYYQRGKLYSDSGDVKSALADCEAGLALDAENESLQWLRGELKKPPAKRFKGKFATPPIDTK